MAEGALELVAPFPGPDHLPWPDIQPSPRLHPKGPRSSQREIPRLSRRSPQLTLHTHRRFHMALRPLHRAVVDNVFVPPVLCLVPGPWPCPIPPVAESIRQPRIALSPDISFDPGHMPLAHCRLVCLHPEVGEFGAHDMGTAIASRTAPLVFPSEPAPPTSRVHALFITARGTPWMVVSARPSRSSRPRICYRIARNIPHCSMAWAITPISPSSNNPRPLDP